MVLLRVLAILALLVAGSAALAAPATPPVKISYQGVLLDDLGNPRTGSVDLTARIYDAVVGGTLLYTQSFAGVPLSDGTFSIVIGPSGEASDVPTDPLSASLADVFVGDLVAGPDRFLEVAVGGDPALARMQILSSPLALRAASAESADSAGTAGVAQDTVTVNGLSGDIYTEIFDHFNFDGGPPNTDPREGTGDTDGDTIANFVDPDNDNDGLDDATEVAQGSDINVVTPDITGVVPAEGDFGFPTQVTVSGTSFEPGMGVVFGSETPAPTNLTPTSFDVTVGPQAAGPVDVQVTRLNGETALEPGAFTFRRFTPTIDAVSPSTGPSATQTPVTITGTQYVPGMSVVFGSQTPTPTNITPTSLDVLVGPQSPGAVDVQVTRPNGESATAAGAFTFVAINAVPHGADFLRLATFDVTGTQTTVAGRLNDDYYLATDPADLGSTAHVVGGQGEADYAFASDGELWGIHCGPTGLPCDVRFLADPDGDGVVTPSFVVESVGASLVSASLAFGPGDEPVGAYTRGGPQPRQVVVAHDRDGDDAYTGPNEVVEVETGIDGATVDVAVDAGGRVALAYAVDIGGLLGLRLAHDRSGDGDYADTVTGAPETQTLLSGAVDCFGVAFDASDRPGVVYVAAGSGTATLVHDLDGDGAFSAGETQALPGAGADACAVTRAASGGLAVATNAEGDTRLFVDDDADGAFSGSESSLLGFPSGDLAIAANDTGQLLVINETRISVPLVP